MPKSPSLKPGLMTRVGKILPNLSRSPGHKRSRAYITHSEQDSRLTICWIKKTDDSRTKQGISLIIFSFSAWDYAS